jgi:hypothetical protein
MSLCLFWLCLTASAGAEPSPGVVPLFAEEAWYREARPPEAVFEGTLERTPTTGTIGGPGRFNPYRLAFKGTPPARELYLPGKAYLLAAHVGQAVRVVGKAVDTEVDGGTHHEIWPARVELPGVIANLPLTAREGVYARGYWRPGDASGFGTRQHVIRTGADLARLMRLTGGSAADEAARRMAELLGVPAIDWQKYMLVSISAGLRGADAERLTVTRVSTADNVLIVSYRLMPPEGPAAGFGIPAETVLVDRFDGEVRFQQEPARIDEPAKP